MQKIRKWLLLVMNFITILQLSGCIFFVSESTDIVNEPVDPNTLQVLAYSEDKEEHEYIVMIKEYNEYVPYLVLTDNYDGSGNSLLLRKNLLDETRRFNENGNGAAYYGYSELDDYLNEEIIKNYTNELQNLIVDSQVEITTRESVEFYGTETEYITRKLFIPSYNELDYSKSDVRPAEGEVLEYFSCNERKIATFENGEARAWWLRTPDIMNDVLVTCVAADGMFFVNGISGPGFDYEMGVRPAFCLPRDTAIVEVDGVNYIEADYNALDLANNAEDRSGELYDDFEVTYYWDAEVRVSKDYKPDGYDENIGNALAIKMEANKNDYEYKYHVVIYPDITIKINEFIHNFNNCGDGIYLNEEHWRFIEDEYYANCYYYIFAADEIKKLAQYDINCKYVGSGEGSLDNANWDTTEGILEYCELYGDGYVAK